MIASNFLLRFFVKLSYAIEPVHALQMLMTVSATYFYVVLAGGTLVIQQALAFQHACFVLH